MRLPEWPFLVAQTDIIPGRPVGMLTVGRLEELSVSLYAPVGLHWLYKAWWKKRARAHEAILMLREQQANLWQQGRPLPTGTAAVPPYYGNTGYATVTNTTGSNSP